MITLGRLNYEGTEIQELMEVDHLNFMIDLDFSNSEPLRIFTKYKNSTLWIDSYLMNKLKTNSLVRVVKTENDDGVEFKIMTHDHYLEGGIYVFTPSGILRYNLVRSYNINVYG